MLPNSETPVHPKKITIHVGGKTSATGSPAPVTGQSGEGEAIRNGTPIGRNPFGGSTATSVNLSQLEKARSMSTSAGPPSPSAAGLAKVEETVRPSPAFANAQPFAPPVMPPASVIPNDTVQQQPPQPPPKLSAADILEAQKYRPHPISKKHFFPNDYSCLTDQSIEESEALMPMLVLTSHPSLPLDKKLQLAFPASPTETQRDIVLSAPASHFRLQLKPQIAPFLEAQNREWKLNVIHDTVRLYPSSGPFDRRGEPVFDVNLHFGVNRLEVSVVAALPKGQKAPNGLTMELERIVIHFNLLRHS